MKQLYIIRHGESELNARHIFAGQIDTPLSKIGESQVAEAGEHAKQLHFDVIVSSPLVRAHRTAEIIAEAIDYPLSEIVVNDIFKERSLGSLEGLSWDEVDETHAKGVDIESWDSLLARATQGLEFLRGIEADTILLAGHGSYIRALQMVIDPTGTYPEPPNAQIVQLV